MHYPEKVLYGFCSHPTLSLLNEQITETLQFTYSRLLITRPLKRSKKGSTYLEFRTTNRKEGRMRNLLCFYSHIDIFIKFDYTRNWSEDGTIHFKKVLYESGRDEFSRVKLSRQRSGGNEDCSGRFDYRGFELPRIQLQNMCDRNRGRIDCGSSHREVRIFRVNFICRNKKKCRGSSARYQDWYALKLPRKDNFFTPFEIESGLHSSVVSKVIHVVSK